MTTFPGLEGFAMRLISQDIGSRVSRPNGESAIMGRVFNGSDSHENGTETAIEMWGRPICTFVIHINSYVGFTCQDAAHHDGDHIVARMPIPDNHDEEQRWRGQV